MKPYRLLIASMLLAVLGACGKEHERAEHGERSGGEAAEHAALPALNPAIGPQSEEALEDPRARIFLVKGCPQCHSISALHVTSPTNAGPDLTVAPTDVQSRFNTTLEKFLHEPTGTMQIVLSSMITLTPAERDSVAKLLRGLDASHRQ